MDPIESIADLFAANAHWSAYEFFQGNTTADTLAEVFRDRYGDRLVASSTVINDFGVAVRKAMDAAALLVGGGVPDIGDIPVMPNALVRSRFVTQGVVTVIATDLGSLEEPYEATVPFQDQSQSIPDIQEIGAGIATTINDSDLSGNSVSASHRKAKEKSRYIRGRGEATEYDITPFFVWRTS